MEKNEKNLRLYLEGKLAITMLKISNILTLVNKMATWKKSLNGEFLKKIMKKHIHKFLSHEVGRDYIFK